jgi:hypothetical protein
MAEVFRAEDTRLGRPVAVKVILADHAADPSFVERFLREARLVASLEHPNILPVYDFGEEGGRPYLVMPFLDGGTLRDRIQGRPVPLAKASDWISQLAGALDAAHEAGILHRDVKPANVLVGKGERIFLADFGIAKMLETITGLTATGLVMGTPLYMAPEQAEGRPATPATDRYALAVVAYEMLAGRPPFEGENPLSLMHQHVTSPPPALSSRAAGLPAGLDAVFARALSKEPAERHATSGEFAAAVAAFAPMGAAGAVAPTIPYPTALAIPAPGRLRSVTTPPPSLTSDETILAAPGGGRKKTAWGALAGLAAIVVLAGGLFLLRGREGSQALRSAEAPPATPALRSAFERLDPSKKPGGRLSQGDFEFALDSARRVLKMDPELPAARFLEILSGGGLSYVARRDGAASQAVVEAFSYSKRVAQKDLGHLGFLVRGPGGAIVAPTGWELALAYGDARGEAEGLLAEALAKRPNDPKALLGRAWLRRIQGRISESIADLRNAVRANPAPAVRQGVLEVLRNECRSGAAEACSEAEKMAAAAPTGARRRFPAAR